MSAYGELARYYDGLTRDVDYTQWVAWYQKWFQRSEVPVKIVLDLACGTGTLTCLLAQACPSRCSQKPRRRRWN